MNNANSKCWRMGDQTTLEDGTRLRLTIANNCAECYFFRRMTPEQGLHVPRVRCRDVRVEGRQCNTVRFNAAKKLIFKEIRKQAEF